VGLVTIAAFILACLLGVQYPSVAASLCLGLFATKQLLQASLSYFRDSVLGSQSINVIVGLVAGISAAKILGGNLARIRGYMNPVWFVTVAIYLWALASCVWSYAGPEGLETFAGGSPYLLLFLVLVPMLIWNIDAWCRLSLIWMLLTTCVAALILLNPEFTIRSGRLGLDVGTGGLKQVRTNPLELGAAGGVCIVLGGLYQSLTWPRVANTLRVVSILVGTVIAVRSGSRGQFAFAVLTVALAYPLSRRITNAKNLVTAALSVAVIVTIVILLADSVRSSGGYQEERRWSSSDFTAGSDIRFSNILLLLGEYASSPARWPAGLGFYSYHYLDPVQEYSHCLSVDMLAELGFVGLGLFGSVLVLTVMNGRRIFVITGDSPRLRNGFGCLAGMTLYQFLLANKQGNLIGSVVLFSLMLIMARIRKSMESEMEPESELTDSHESSVRPQ
jgi:hypothetical protein